jgi:hypothetical protein
VIVIPSFVASGVKVILSPATKVKVSVLESAVIVVVSILTFPNAF